MSTPRLALLLLPLLSLVVTGCRTRMLGSLPYEGPPDFTVVRDLTFPPDLYIPPDFTPPPDLTRPEYCNGIYTFQSDRRIAFFDPRDGSFNDVRQLPCAAAGSPFSMGVGKDGVAWVEYSTSPSTLFRYNVKTEACTPTNFQNPGGVFSNFGMGFAADGTGGTTETLYLAGASAQGNDPQLGSLDVQTLAIKPIGSLSGRAELTGTGDGQLWAFFADVEPHMAQLDKTTAQPLLDVPLPALGDLSGSAFAFAAWGGDFYAFITGGPMGGATTSIWRIHQTNGTLDELKPVKLNTPVVIVGAGVSTCAPTGLDQ